MWTRWGVYYYSSRECYCSLNLPGPCIDCGVLCIFSQNQGAYCLEHLTRTQSEINLRISGYQNRHFRWLKRSSRNVEPSLLNTISWAFALRIIYSGWRNLWNCFQSGVRNASRGYEHFSRLMTGQFSSSAFCHVPVEICTQSRRHGMQMDAWSHIWWVELFCRAHTPWLSRRVDVQAIAIFDCILPLMPELFRFSEGRHATKCCLPINIPLVVNDDDELAARADLLLNRMCGVSPPRPLLNRLLDSVFHAIKTSSVHISSHPWSQFLIRPLGSHGKSEWKPCRWCKVRLYSLLHFRIIQVLCSLVLQTVPPYFRDKGYGNAGCKWLSVLWL